MTSLQASDQFSDPIFLCASLPGEVYRQRSFAKNFSSQHAYAFVDSVDGRQWSEEEADSYCSMTMKELRQRERDKGKRWLNPAAIACALTHRDKLIALSEKRNVILCEDDSIIEGDFIALWHDKSTQNTFAKCDSVVLIHYRSASPITSSAPPVAEFGKYKIFRVDDGNVGSGACYYLPPNIANRVRKYQTPINVSADSWQQMRHDGVFKNVFVVSPSPVRIAPAASNIGYGNASDGNGLLTTVTRKIWRRIQRFRRPIYDELTIRK